MTADSSSSATLPKKSDDSDPAAMGVAGMIGDARRGDMVMLGELLQVYRNYLSVLASSQIDKRLQPRVSPSDIVQETMMKAHRAFGDFRGSTEAELLVWLRQILVNNLATFVEQHLIAAKRDVRREVSIEKLGASLEQSTIQLGGLLPAEVNSPSVSAQRREDAVVLADRISQLPEDYREVLMLRNLRGLAFSDVAAIIGRSEGAARMLWLRAIEKLRDVYRQDQEE